MADKHERDCSYTEVLFGRNSEGQKTSRKKQERIVDNIKCIFTGGELL
jgi:hypothetical protein